MSRRTLPSWQVGLVACAVAVLGAFAPGTASARDAAKDRPLFREGEVIVKFAPGTRLGAMNAMAASVHAQAQVAKTMEATGSPHVALVRFPKSVPVNTMVERFRAKAGVLYAEPNHLAYIPEYGQGPVRNIATKRAVHGKDGRSTIDPKKAINPVQAKLIDRANSQFLDLNNDTYRTLQDGWSWISGDVIWPDKLLNPEIAVIDTGVDYFHEDLKGRVFKGTDWVNNDTDPMDDNGHGTHVSGIAAAMANNGKGVAGVSTAKILAIKVLSAEGSGSYFDIAQGITQAAGNAAVKIISMSLGGGCGSATLTTAMDLAATKGKLIVVAMGNSSKDISGDTGCPAAYADAAFDATTAPVTVAVGASGLTHWYDTSTNCPDCFYTDYSCMASYSNWATWMSVVAPGTDIYSTLPQKREFWLGTYYGFNSNYDYLSGTSMATPMVAGAAARTFSAMPAGTTAAAVKTRLVATGTPDITNGQNGGTPNVDTDGDGVADTECWATAAGISTATTATNVAASMLRAEADGFALNANGALGLTGGKVVALSGTSAKGFGGDVDLFGQGAYRVLNIPMNNTTAYDFAVSKATFTVGAQKFTNYSITDCGADTNTINCVYNFNEQVSVAPNSSGRVNLITDWGYSGDEIDQYLYGPSASATANCSVGYSGSCGSGELQVAPFMKWLHDGGPYSGSGAVELTQIKTPLAAQGAGTPYEIFTTDYCLGTSCGANMYDDGATFRLWAAGKIVATVRASAGDVATHNCDIGAGTVGCDAWYIGDLSSAGVFTSKNLFGVGAPSSVPDGVYPYLFRPSERTNDGGTRGGAVTRPRGARAQRVQH